MSLSRYKYKTLKCVRTLYTLKCEWWIWFEWFDERTVIHGTRDRPVLRDVFGGHAHRARHGEVLVLTVVDTVLHVDAEDHLDSQSVAKLSH